VEAKNLLERSLNRCQAEGGAYYLLGLVCAKLRLHPRAFYYFTEAGKRSPEDRELSKYALEQLLESCLHLVRKGLESEKDHHDLRRELFRLASLKKKLQAKGDGQVEQ
jgi:hypothetical protein